MLSRYEIYKISNKENICHGLLLAWHIAKPIGKAAIDRRYFDASSGGNHCLLVAL